MSSETADASSSRRDGDRTSRLRVVVIYPDLLGTYGDAGNGRVLAGRAAWRGIDVELVMALSDAALPESGDIYCIGGGEDGPQIRAAERLAGGALNRAVAGGASVLAVCAGYQIMGSSFPGPDGAVHDGIGLLDIATVKGRGPRSVGEVLSEALPPPPDLASSGGSGLWPASGVAGSGGQRLTGFENHGGVTSLGPSTRPFARVITGDGNGPDSGTDGAWTGKIVGTYLHGPVLARNPALADLLLTLATGTVPAPLDDSEEEALHDERLSAAAGVSRGAARSSIASWRRLVRGRS